MPVLAWGYFANLRVLHRNVRVLKAVCNLQSSFIPFFLMMIYFSAVKKKKATMSVSVTFFFLLLTTSIINKAINIIPSYFYSKYVLVFVLLVISYLEWNRLINKVVFSEKSFHWEYYYSHRGVCMKVGCSVIYLLNVKNYLYAHLRFFFQITAGFFSC